mmetsp:Transcript_114578/g.335049  ORF Transcript_114578/g.335049 Transcript_114578/m.335049 type:complete len:239 (-) Transcript_114578:520-1236(-)
MEEGVPQPRQAVQIRRSRQLQQLRGPGLCEQRLAELPKGLVVEDWRATTAWCPAREDHGQQVLSQGLQRPPADAAVERHKHHAVWLQHGDQPRPGSLWLLKMVQHAAALDEVEAPLRRPGAQIALLELEVPQRKARLALPREPDGGLGDVQAQDRCAWKAGCEVASPATSSTTCHQDGLPSCARCLDWACQQLRSFPRSQILPARKDVPLIEALHRSSIILGWCSPRVMFRRGFWEGL